MLGTISGWRRWTAIMAVIASAIAAVPVSGATLATPEKEWTANPDDSLLFDVHVGKYRLGDGVRGYATPQGDCVDLGDMILTLDLPVRLDKKLHRATGWIFDERRTIAIDRDANTAQIMNGKEILARSTIRDTAEGWCALVPKLAQWMGIQIKEDKGNAILVLVSDTKLPMESALDRKERAENMRPTKVFDLKSLPQARVVYAGIRPPAVDVVASVGGLRDMQTGSALNLNYELYASGEVGRVAYDARLASDQNGLPSSLRVRAYRTDADAHLLGPLRATHVEVGDVTGVTTPLVAQTTVGRGFMLTNQPIGQSNDFSRTSFVGELPNGWDVELYRNNQLLALASSRPDGRYEFDDVALQFGQNHFEIILYGPQGQRRKETKDITVGANSIPPKQTYYWAGIDEAGYDLLTLTHAGLPQYGGWRGSFGLERGLDAKTSVSAMFHSLVLSDGDGRRDYSEFALRRSLGPVLFELSESNSLTDGGLAWRAQMLGQFGKLYVSAESINASHGYESDRVLQGVTGIQTLSLDDTIKLGQAVLPVHVDTKLTTYATQPDVVETTARLSANLGRWLMTGGLEWDHTMVKSGPPPPDDLSVDMLLNGHIGHLLVRGETKVQLVPTPVLQTVTLVGEWKAGHKADKYCARWRAELGYDRSLSRGHLGLSYIRQFKKIAVSANGEVASDGSVAGGLSLAFSLGTKPDGGIRMSSEKLASHGSVLVRVFRDLNHNGIHDPSEPWVKGVQITAGIIPIEALSNANGEVMIDGLRTFEPLLLGIDASSLADPMMQPEGPGLVVTPRPGITQEIELGVASAGEVDGTLVKPGGGHIEGADLELVDPAGNVAGHARSEFDGYVLFENVPYGHYTVRLSKVSAEVLHANAALNQAAVVGDKTENVHLGTIVVQPLQK